MPSWLSQSGRETLPLAAAVPPAPEVWTARVPFRVVAGDPPVTPGHLPYVLGAVVGSWPTERGDGHCYSSGDSLPVSIRGEFPDDRHSLLWTELLSQGPGRPPIVRLVVDDGACPIGGSARRSAYWNAYAMLPPQPAGPTALTVQVARVSCGLSVQPGNLFADSLSFVVSDSCRKGDCLRGTWVRPGTSPGQDVLLERGQSVTADLAVRSPMALAELWGEFDVVSAGTSSHSPSGIRLVRVEAIGPAAGMRLETNAEWGGISFKLTAPGGRSIPATPAGEPASAILRVTVAADSDIALESLTSLYLNSLSATDGSSRWAGECHLSPGEPMFPDAFLIRASEPCDYNSDGILDVRDLTLMAQCAAGIATCPDSAAGRLDCTRDSLFDVGDVRCCIRRILTDRSCGACFVDSAALRPAPGVRLELDPPVMTAAGENVTMRLSGLGELGGARVALLYPPETYEVSSVDISGEAGSWLYATSVRYSRVLVGLARSGAVSRLSAGEPIEVVAHLRLKPGVERSGSVRISEAQFAGPDAVLLRVGQVGSALSLSGPGEMRLQPNRPNPFTFSTRIFLSLEFSADVDAAVYDVSGRCVAELFRGRAPRGGMELRWDGRTREGVPAGSGIYFARATSLGRVISRKMLLVRGS
ncbi:MAG: hypothetical protein HZB25_09410 [Candidatus Eisenbacteria bacterium]|nr:hypothetical protein [Candidatus Eisenbacteria bacterium]